MYGPEDGFTLSGYLWWMRNGCLCLVCTRRFIFAVVCGAGQVIQRSIYGMSHRREASEDRLQMAGGGDSADSKVDTRQDSGHLVDLVKHYRETASVHGVAQVGDKQLYCFRRCLWVFLMIAMLGGLSTLMYLHFKRYVEYPTVTVVLAHTADTVPFPATTICNLNQFHSSRIPNDQRLRDLLYKMSDFAYIHDNIAQPEGFAVSTMETAKVETGEELKAFALNAAHRLSDMFKYCVFRTQKMPCEDLFNVTLTDIGVCFTFNANPDRPRFNSTDSGPVSGLRVILNIEQDFYYFSRHTQSGLKVLLHEPDEAPLLINRGFFVRPGTCTDVVIRREERTSLGTPYKAFGDTYCLDTRSPDFRSPLTRFRNYSFTEQSCWRDCYTDRLVQLCGCRHFFDPGDDEVCSIHDLETCYIPNAGTILSKWIEKISMEEVKACDCHLPCSEVGYSASMSFTDFASKFVVKHMFNSNLLTNIAYVRENVIELKVYYDTLTVSDVQQQPEMSVMGIFGDMGGHMGLFLGASILSVTEILEVILLAVCSCCLGRWSAMRNAAHVTSRSAERNDHNSDRADSVF